VAKHRKLSLKQMKGIRDRRRCPRCYSWRLTVVSNYGHPNGELQCLDCKLRLGYKQFPIRRKPCLHAVIRQMAKNSFKVHIWKTPCGPCVEWNRTYESEGAARGAIDIAEIKIRRGRT